MAAELTPGVRTNHNPGIPALVIGPQSLDIVDPDGIIGDVDITFPGEPGYVSHPGIIFRTGDLPQNKTVLTAEARRSQKKSTSELTAKALRSQ